MRMSALSRFDGAGGSSSSLLHCGGLVKDPASHRRYEGMYPPPMRIVIIRFPDPLTKLFLCRLRQQHESLEDVRGCHSVEEIVGGDRR